MKLPSFTNSKLSFAIKSAIATTALVAMSVPAAAAPQVYGRVYMTITNDDVKTDSTALQDIYKDGELDKKAGDAWTTKRDRATMDGGNRIGVRGSEPLNDKLDLEYQLEYRLYADSDNTRNWESRTTRLSLNHKDYGKLSAGRLIMIDDEIDYADKTFGLLDSGYFPFAYGPGWANNSFTYHSPTINNTTFMAMYAMDEDNDTDRNFTTFVDGKKVRTSRDFAGIGALYDTDKLKLGATYLYAGDEFSTTRAMASYNVTPKLNTAVMLQHTDFNSDANEFGVSLGTNYKFDDKLSGWVQLGYADNYGGWKDGESQSLNVGVMRWLGKTTRAYGYLGARKTTDFSNDGDIKNVTKSKGFGVSLRHDF
ncbi:hypothetical protein B0181_03480 [Moraxella caviae]|uniref:Outer membrane protein (Porin) n=1 Tax=Moraxella caviae TaxID=34060 RepID=A0A1T0A640_9GAMM|nr:porin [Moraxella caviae]OOR91196.1 hypothetical protein B0181_03480 [Moraxella caviae]STZ13760.1 Outer membrane protein (porin) [Moraxella caviae]VEW12679.1 Outer membrane protein (porin) [Moraxella caviae]